jgi:hypothetical protein
VPLEGVKAKLRRATEHLETLDQEWRSFIEREPYAALHELKPETCEWTSRFLIEKAIPIEISVTMGDALHNLRSCLDHLVGCFVERHGRTIEHHHAFPIYADAATFKGRAQRARRKDDRGGPLSGIPCESGEWALIERSQPYQGGDDPREHPLAILNEMVNIDKHRRLHAAMTYPEARSALDLLVWEPLDAKLLDHTPLWEPGRPLEHGTDIATLRFSRERPAEKVSMKAPITLSVAFGDHDPERPRGDFGAVVSYVSEIISRAEVLLL